MGFALLLIKRIPLIISTIFKHYVYGPPQPSWNLSLHLKLALLQSLAPTNTSDSFTIEGSQGLKLESKAPKSCKTSKIVIPQEYRINAQTYIEKIIKPYSIIVDPIWKSPPNDGINGEIIMNKNWDFNDKKDDWEKEKIVLYLHGGAYFTGKYENAREAMGNISEKSDARILSIDYRLAPQQPFPAALCDALAAYLYLSNPPSDSGLRPYKPEQIVLLGDSAGGGLSLALSLALRDLGLQLPAGIVGWAPWVDLTSSMPSFSDSNIDKTDYLPSIPGLILADNPNSPAYREFRRRTGDIARKIQQHPEIKIIGDDSLKRIDEEAISYYVVNEGLGIPYVSPMLAESLGGLPPILIVIGNVERLRDESIYLAYRASEPEKYRLPAYEVDFDNSSFKTPTKVTLELYDEMFHDFQFSSSCNPSKVSVQRTADFIKNVVQEASVANPSSSSLKSLRISYQGEVRPLDESSIENVLRWDKAGVFPGV